jgi:hypothetical protein
VVVVHMCVLCGLCEMCECVVFTVVCWVVSATSDNIQ